MADRRDVPRVALPLHLRPGLSGRAHRACARARAGLLLVRRARLRQEGPPQDRDAWPKSSATTSGSSASGASKQRRLEEDRQGRLAHPARRRRVRLPESSRLRDRSRMRAAPARRSHRASTSARPSRRSAGSSRCARSTVKRRTSRSRRCSPSSAATDGAKAARSSRGGAPKRRRRSPRPSRCTSRWRPSCGDMLGDDVYEQVAKYLDARIGSGAPPMPHPAEVPVSLGRTRTRRP